jgi:hypothetical protein
MGYLNIVTITALGLRGQTSGNMQRRKPAGHWHLASQSQFVNDDTIHKRNTTINLASYLSQQQQFHSYCLNASTVRILLLYGCSCVLE